MAEGIDVNCNAKSSKIAYSIRTVVMQPGMTPLAGMTSLVARSVMISNVTNSVAGAAPYVSVSESELDEICIKFKSSKTLLQPLNNGNMDSNSPLRQSDATREDGVVLIHAAQSQTNAVCSKCSPYIACLCICVCVCVRVYVCA